MAEAMELDLTLKESTNSPLENPIVPPIGTLEKKNSENVPSQFTIQKYYDNEDEAEKMTEYLLDSRTEKIKEHIRRRPEK